DTFRAWYPLMTIINPDKSRDWIYSLYEGYKQGGLLPKWSLTGNYTGTMVGYPALSLFADAVTKGLADSIPGELLEAAITSASWQPEWHEKHKGTRALNVMPEHIMYKESIGFVPVDKCSESVSWGLEMAYYDWCLARIADHLGENRIAEEWYGKGLYYMNYYDSSTGFMRARNSYGNWYSGFNPNYSSHERSEYTEGNAWQWTPFVPHDIGGLQELMGGKEEMGVWLDTLFTTESIIEGEHASGDITGLIGQYAHGNEPSHHVAYLYNYTDRPWRTGEIVDSILYNFYLPSPEGIIGNEDCGQMSAWYILSALGFYQVAPGDPVYDAGRPVVEGARIRTGNGWFTIKTHNNSRENKYIEKMVLNGRVLSEPRFRHEDIKTGGMLEFYMDNEPML
ncbi:MAG: GH92 family glycosyl hydrolase, partial [Bacteroidales bacterium]